MDQQQTELDDDQQTEPTADIEGVAPFINADDPVALGVEAWERLKSNARMSWDDWKLVGDALLAGRKWAMKQAAAKSPKGKGYIIKFSHWIEENGFSEIEDSDRTRLL